MSDCTCDIQFQKEEWILAMSGHSYFPLCLLPICLHSEESLLIMVDAFSYFTLPLGMIQRLSLPGTDAGIAFLYIVSIHQLNSIMFLLSDTKYLL